MDQFVHGDDDEKMDYMFVSIQSQWGFYPGSVAPESYTKNKTLN